MIPNTLCYGDYCISKPYVLLFIIPLFIVLYYFINKDFIKFKSVQDKERFRKEKKGIRISLLVTRTLMLFMLLVAFSLPFTTEEEFTNGDPVIKLLIDSTKSMDVFESQMIDIIKEKLKDVPIEISQISSGDRSELGDGIIRKIEGNDNLLILSDGNNHFGKSLLDTGIYARLSDTRLFAVNMETKRNDAYVTIVGPSETIQGTTNRFRIMVNYIGSQPSFTLQVYVDGNLEFSRSADQLSSCGMNCFEEEILKTFGDGYHKMTAKLLIADFISQNNLFYKTIKTVPKPKIAFVSSGDSPMKAGLRDIYALSTFSSIPLDLTSYSAVILNDMPYSSLSSRIDDLTGFLLDGNGLVFIGGKNSFDNGDYKDTLIESMLPVRIGSGKIIDPLKNNIVIVLDVSDSFSDYSYKSGSSNSALDFGKGLAVKMINEFRDDISVGLVAFAAYGQIVATPVDLADNRDLLISKITHLRGGDGTAIDQGLIMAEKALDGVTGTKNVILISDGKMGHLKEPHMPKVVAQRMASKGIKIYTVGIASTLYENNENINEYYMNLLASIGNGAYFAPKDSQYLNLFFGKPEVKDQVFSGNSNLAIIDRDHFITNNIDIDARVTGVNFVVPKPGSRNLIYTSDSNPILNTWNFGLGRVTTLATDDGSRWAGNLLSQENSILLTRVINYAVGNPEKGKDIYIQTSDTFLGEPAQILIKSDKYPVSKELVFTKEGEDLYKSEFSSDKEGFYQFFDAIIAVNPPREYYGLGLNQKLSDMCEVSGGKLLDMEDKDLVDTLKTFTRRMETVRKDVSYLPLTVMLIIFMIEMIIRKIFEYRRYKVIRR